MSDSVNGTWRLAPLIAAVLAVLGVWVWAWWPLTLTSSGPDGIAALPAAPGEAPVRYEWALPGWRDAAPVRPAPVASRSVTLVSVFRSGGIVTAVFDPGGGQPLVYATVGQAVGGETVTAINGMSVTVRGPQGERTVVRPSTP